MMSISTRRRLIHGFGLLVFAASLGAHPPLEKRALAQGSLGGFPPVPPIASYRIETTLDAAAKTLTGQEIIRYTNTTPDPIPDLVFHLYLNAFRSQESTFLRESGTAHSGFAWNPDQPGWIQVQTIRLKSGPELVLQEIEDGTLARAALPSPVAPGESIEVEVSFLAQLPQVFARTGWALDAAGAPFFMVGQWFPKLGVWQKGAWNAYTFHANAEFYADFGTYDVAITLPSGYVTGGVGVLAGQTVQVDGTQTVQYHAEGVIDFSWTASPNFQTITRQVGNTEIVYLVLPEHAWSIDRIMKIAEAALHDYGQWYGPYAYPRLTLVDVPDSGEGAGGMEYPTLVTLGTQSLLGVSTPLQQWGADRTPDTVAAHEIGHQWWQSMVAFNEAEEPWLDEGITDYSTVRLVNEIFGADGSAIAFGNLKLGYLDERRLEYLGDPNVPMYGKAWEFNGLLTYGIAAYAKPALSLTTLQRVLGEEKMNAIMKTFFQRYQFAHPTTEDFRQVAEEASGQDLSWFFDGLVYGKGTVNYTVSQIDARSFTAVRQGDARVPTEILVSFEDGSAKKVNWDGVKGEKVFTYSGSPALKSAIIDPEHKIVVDLLWSDNGLSRRADLPAWLALIVRLVYNLQNGLLAWGGL